MPRRAPGFNFGRFTPAYPGERDPWASNRPELERQGRLLEPSALARWAPRVATAGTAAFLGAAALPAVFGGGGAAAASAAPTGGGFWGGVTAPSFGAGGAASAGGAGVGAGSVIAPAAGRFTMGNLLRMGEIGIPAITGIFANRSQNRALDRQTAVEQANLAAQMQFVRDQEAQRRAEAERMFIEDQRRWEAEERNRARDVAAADEERAFQRRLVEEREQRRQQGRMRMDEFLARGRRR